MGLASIITTTDITAASPQLQTETAGNPYTLTMLYQSACAIADKYVGRNLALETTTEYYDGSQSIYLNLKRWPVTAITEVKHDLAGGYGQITGTFGTSTVLTLGTNYIVDYAKGILTILQPNTSYDWFARGYNSPTLPSRYGMGLVANYVPASWGQVPGSVKVTYSAGYTAPPPFDLVSAVAQIAMYLLQANNTGGLIETSTSYIDVSSSRSQQMAVDGLYGGVPALATARQILDAYCSPKIGTGWVL